MAKQNFFDEYGEDVIAVYPKGHKPKPKRYSAEEIIEKRLERLILNVVRMVERASAGRHKIQKRFVWVHLSNNIKTTGDDPAILPVLNLYQFGTNEDGQYERKGNAYCYQIQVFGGKKMLTIRLFCDIFGKSEYISVNKRVTSFQEMEKKVAGFFVGTDA